MDPESKHEAENVFSSFCSRSPPATRSNAFRPSNDDHLLVQPKKVVNPAMTSTSHTSMRKELKLNNKLGVSVLNQKSELDRVFRDRQREQFHQNQVKDLPPKSEFELQLERRRKLSEPEEFKEDSVAAAATIPEFVQMKERLRKTS